MAQVVLMEVAEQVAPTGQAVAVERRAHMEVVVLTGQVVLMEVVELVV
jgi:hypothetical protein